MESKKVALIIGINGQIGSYLYEILREKGYKIYGIIRHIPSKVLPDVTYLMCDLEDSSILKKHILNIRPNEIYNMAAQSDAVISIEQPEYTMAVNCNVVIALCEVVKELGGIISCKLFQASSMELYKGLDKEVIDEDTLEFYPKNPYAIAKLAAYWIVRHYREQYGCYINNGIISNAESPRRDIKFVTRKILASVKEIIKDPKFIMKIGNLDAQRDWIHAYDVAMAAWLMLQQDKPGDYIIGLGTNHSVRYFIERSFLKVGIKVKWIRNSDSRKELWEGIPNTVDEIAVDALTGRVLVIVDPTLFRIYETKAQTICGNNNKLKSIGWVPKYSLDDIITDIVNI